MSWSITKGPEIKEFIDRVRSPLDGPNSVHSKASDTILPIGVFSCTLIVAMLPGSMVTDRGVIVAVVSEDFGATP